MRTKKRGDARKAEEARKTKTEQQQEKRKQQQQHKEEVEKEKKRRKVIDSHKTVKKGLETEVPDVKPELQDVENNQKVQGRRKPGNTGIARQKIRYLGAAEGRNDTDVEQGAITGKQGAGISGGADVLLQLKQALHDIRQLPAAQPANGSQHLCATSSQSVAAFEPPPHLFVAPRHISATCLPYVATFQPPRQPFVTPQNPFSMHAQYCCPAPAHPGRVHIAELSVPICDALACCNNATSSISCLLPIFKTLVS